MKVASINLHKIIVALHANLFLFKQYSPKFRIFGLRLLLRIINPAQIPSDQRPTRHAEKKSYE